MGDARVVHDAPQAIGPCVDRCAQARHLRVVGHVADQRFDAVDPVEALGVRVTAQMTFEEIIMARDEAMNADDVDTAVSLYADDATVLAVIGDTARAFCTWAIDGLRSDGVGHIEQFEEFVFKDGTIIEHTMTVLRMVPC